MNRNGTRRVRTSGGGSSTTQKWLVSAAPDWYIVTGDSSETLARVKQVVTAFLEERGLSLSDEKTSIVHISDGFDFLGFNVRMYESKLLITPAKAAMKRVRERIRTTIRENKAVSQAVLMRLLNPIIRGWVNYHRTVVSSRAFERFDYAVWQALWQWAVRRHRGKGAAWVRKRYFRTIHNRTWTFACEGGTTEQPKLVKLVYATDTSIRRHRKVKAEANPYSPTWEAYFEERLTRRMGTQLMGNTKAWHLWLLQAGNCPECGEPITEETGWHIHHVVYRVHGGTDALPNLQLLHPTCHRKRHAHAPLLPSSRKRALGEA